MKTAQVTDISPSRPQVPMREAAAILAELCHRLDDGEEPTAAVQAVFAETQLELAEAIDRRKAVKEILERQAAAAREMAKGLTEHAKRMDAAVDALKQRTLEIVQAFPDQPYRDSAGRKLSVVANQGKLVISLDTGSKSVTNILADADIMLHKIPLDYVKIATFFTLDTAAVKAALDGGKEIPWARIERGVHLRGL